MLFMPKAPKDLIFQGILYLKNSLMFDTITLVAISLTIFLIFYKNDKRLTFSGLGIIGYICYIVIIGGDFMSGRFLSLPLFATAAILAQIDLKKIFHIVLIIAFIVIGLSVEYPTLSYNENYSNKEIRDGIVDERGYYYKCSGLLTYFPHLSMGFISN